LVKNLGEYFGRMSGAAITLRYKFVYDKLAIDKKLEKMLYKIKSRILNN